LVIMSVYIINLIKLKIQTKSKYNNRRCDRYVFIFFIKYAVASIINAIAITTNVSKFTKRDIAAATQHVSAAKNMGLFRISIT